LKTEEVKDNVDYRLLGLLSRLVICSSCLRAGKITPVPQIVSDRHTPRSLCQEFTTHFAETDSSLIGLELSGQLRHTSGRWLNSIFTIPR